MTPDERRFRVVAIGLIALSLLAIVILVTSFDYLGRATLANSLRAGCGRSIIDRVAIINVSWAESQANATEAALFSKASSPKTRKALAAFIAERRLEGELQAALATSDAARVEPAQAIQLPVPLQHLAKFSCAAAFPSASVIP